MNSNQQTLRATVCQVSESLLVVLIIRKILFDKHTHFNIYHSLIDAHLICSPQRSG